MTYISIAILIIAISILIIAMIILSSVRKNNIDEHKLGNELSSSVGSTLGNLISSSIKQGSDAQSDKLSQMDRTTSDKLSQMDKTITDKINMIQAQTNNQQEQIEKRFHTFTEETTTRLENIRTSVDKNLQSIRDDNNKKLDDMRMVVDEKLQKTINDRMTESFKQVSERLEQVSKGLGEMQSLAQGVGDLKKVLSNVKSRGIVGEIQLGAIIGDILSPDQYDTDVAIIKNSSYKVEFAIKIPAEDGTYIYLPIDSKFPGDTYAALRDAYDMGDKDEIDKARKNLADVLKSEARDISTKYIAPPDTTEFGIMFLPFEGLYAEAINLDMVATLQKNYHVNIAGPSTMAALLNSLQMSFRTIAIQRRSGEVWTVLAAVKKEFDSFADILANTQKRLQQADTELEKLVGTRTRAIQRKLRGVEKLSTDLSAEESSRILELDSDAAYDEANEESGE